ncbi:hypothetical protein D3C86_1683060 [compost metagenome]
MPIFDVKPTDPAFETIQKISATGILKTKGESYQWANRTWFYPDATISIQEFTEGLNQFDKKNKIVKNQEKLTEAKAVEILTKAGGTFKNKEKYSTKIITKKELAILINESLNPFSKEIDFSGNNKK